MRVVLLGGSGFIGGALTALLLEHGCDVVVTTRSPSRESGVFRKADGAAATLSHAQWDNASPAGWLEALDGAKACVNLVGENIAAGRWTSERKQRILGSRLNAGRLVCEAVAAVSTKPEVLIQASAIGVYGLQGDELLTEDGPAPAPLKPSFLADVAKTWEASTLPVEQSGVRRVIARTGVVLGRGGGALEKMLPAFRMFAGGPLGDGKQWLSWIHLRDVVRAMLHLIETPSCQGAYNLTAPTPVPMREFSQILGKILHRPSWLSVPAFNLRLALGEMADELLLNGQRVAPQRLLDSGFHFEFPLLEDALRDLLT
jgi:uncharacterized protein (TIGR01777 family)